MKKIAFFVLLSVLTLIFAADALAQKAGEFGTIVSSELIFPAQEQHVHGSSVVELPNGDLLAVWFYGSGERTANDVRLMGARLKKGADKWSDVFPMADAPGVPDCNPVLFLNSKGKLFLVWITVLGDRWETSILRCRTSVDYEGDGPPVWEWQDDIFFKPTDAFADEVRAKIYDVDRPAGIDADAFKKELDGVVAMAENLVTRSTGWMTRIPPIRLKSGRILLPLYSDGFNFSMIAISDDDGQTWRPSLPIVGRGIQPSLAVKKDGTVVAYMRKASHSKTKEPPRLWTAESKDDGQTWTLSHRTDFPSEASVDLFALADGRWIYVANDIDSRHLFSLFVSDDEGQTWKRGETLEFDPSKSSRYCYPCVIQTQDGMVHITYSSHGNSGDKESKTIKHIVIDPVRLTGEIPK